MSAPLKHLIDPVPAPRDAGPPQTPCCRVVEALAGDCTSPISERLRIVETECGFGARCSRDCNSLPPPECGFVGVGRVIASQVADPGAGIDAGNSQRF